MKKLILILSIGLALIGLMFPYISNSQLEPEEEGNPYIEQTISDGSKSVIKIIHKMVNGDQYLTKTSSAVVMHSDDNYYYSVTNYHALVKSDYQSYSIDVFDYQNTKYDAEIYSLNQAQQIISEMYDLGIIRFNKKDYELPIPTIRDMALTTTTLLTAVGYPDGIRTITSGSYNDIVSLSGYTTTLIEHSVELLPGNSGGGLFDNKNRLIGINVAGLFDDNGSFIKGYSIPINKVYEYLSLFDY